MKSVPNAIGAWLVGSSTAEYGLIADIDIVALVKGGAGEKFHLNPFNNLPVEVTYFDPLLPRALLYLPEVSFLLLRSMRQISHGKVLFGRTNCMIFQTEMEKLTIEISCLTRLLDSTNKNSLFDHSLNTSRLPEVFNLVENIVFVASCAYSPLGPRKPKHYLRETEKCFPPAILDALSAVGNIALRKLSIAYLKNVESEWIDAPINPIFNTLIRDTRSLCQAKQFLEASICLLAYVSRSKRAVDAELGDFKNCHFRIHEMLNITLSEALKKCLSEKIIKANGQLQNELDNVISISVHSPLVMLPLRDIS